MILKDIKKNKSWVCKGVKTFMNEPDHYKPGRSCNRCGRSLMSYRTVDYCGLCQRKMIDEEI